MAHTTDRYTIFTAANENFREGLHAFLLFVCVAWKSENDLEIAIMEDELSPQTRAKARAITAASPHITLRFVEVQTFGTDVMPSLRPYTNNIEYSRLWIRSLTEADDVLYCDCDFLFFIDPIELFQKGRHSPQPICASHDVSTHLHEDCVWKDQLSPNELDLPYFNAGLMYLRLTDPLFARLPDIVLDLAAQAPSPPPLNDQSFLNMIFRGRVEILDQRFNTVGNANAHFNNWDGDRNIHFTGAHKPFFHRSREFKRHSCNAIYDAFVDGEFRLPRIIFELQRLWQLGQQSVFKFLRPRKARKLARNHTTWANLKRIEERASHLSAEHRLRVATVYRETGTIFKKQHQHGWINCSNKV